MSQYPASGILFQNDRKQKETQPDYTGSMEVDPSVVRDLYAQLEEGNDRPKATLAGWKRYQRMESHFSHCEATCCKSESSKATIQGTTVKPRNNKHRQAYMMMKYPFKK